MKSWDSMSLLWQDAADNIRLYKQQQITATNYGAAILVALVGVKTIILKEGDNLPEWLVYSLPMMAVGASAIAIKFVWQLDWAIWGNRKRLVSARKHFDEASWEMSKAFKKEGHGNWRYGVGAPFALTAILALGCIPTIWILVGHVHFRLFAGLAITILILACWILAKSLWLKWKDEKENMSSAS